jgi:AcrR family transcriptional regulator
MTGPSARQVQGRRSPGRPPGATRDEVVAAARRRFRRRERVDVVALCAELGLGRVTVYRWFGSREGLLSEVLAAETEEVFATARRRAQGTGAQRLLDVFDDVNRVFAGSAALRHFVRTEPQAARRTVLSTTGAVHERCVALVAQAVEEEVRTGAYVPAVDVGTLAYAIERLAVAFLYDDDGTDVRGDVDRLREVEAALLGIAPAPRRRS